MKNYTIRNCRVMNTCGRLVSALASCGERVCIRFASTMSKPSLVGDQPDLYKARVTFDIPGPEKRRMEIDAVYQDTLPSGSALGTVVALHGSPDSHKCWKYVTGPLVAKGIRVINVNWPGFGLSTSNQQLSHDNAERNAFIQSLLDGLALNSRLIFMGHSRGTENALQLTAANKDRSVGAALINPTGLRMHKGIKPFWFFTGIVALHDKVPLLRRPIYWFTHRLYNFVGLRVSRGEYAVAALTSMSKVALGKQADQVAEINRTPHLRSLVCTVDNDKLVEAAIYREFLDAFEGRKHLSCLTGKKTTREQEDEWIDAMGKAFASGTRAVTVEFHDGHFLQKERARFIAEGLEMMLRAAK